MAKGLVDAGSDPRNNWTAVRDLLRCRLRVQRLTVISTMGSGDSDMLRLSNIAFSLLHLQNSRISQKEMTLQEFSRTNFRLVRPAVKGSAAATC